MFERVSNYVSFVLVALAVAGLVFRATLYWRLPVNPNEAYGVADVLELLVFGVMLSLSAVSTVLALILGVMRRYRVAIRVFVIAVITPMVFYLLHPLVPKLI